MAMDDTELEYVCTVAANNWVEKLRELDVRDAGYVKALGFFIQILSMEQMLTLQRMASLGDEEAETKLQEMQDLAMVFG